MKSTAQVWEKSDKVLMMLNIWRKCLHKALIVPKTHSWADRKWKAGDFITALLVQVVNMSLYGGHIAGRKEKVLQALIFGNPFKGAHHMSAQALLASTLHTWPLCALPGDYDMLFVWKENKHPCQCHREGIKDVIIPQDGAKGWILSSHCVGKKNKG